MNRIVLISAEGLAREVMDAAAAGGIDLVGVLDDAAALRLTAGGAFNIVGRVEDAVRFPDVQFVICATLPETRRRLAQQLAGLGISDSRFATIVDATVRVAQGCTIAPGSIVLAHTVLGADSHLGLHTVLMPRVTVGYGSTIGDFSTVCAGASLGDETVLGEAVRLGMHVSVEDRVGIGAGAAIGAGSAVDAEVPPGEHWSGVPARRNGGAQVPASGGFDGGRSAFERLAAARTSTSKVNGHRTTGALSRRT
ncbi:MAG: hypothetical protein ACHP7K_00890 [Actinomycetales bacterium]